MRSPQVRMARIESDAIQRGQGLGFHRRRTAVEEAEFPQTDHQAISIAVQRYLALAQFLRAAPAPTRCAKWPYPSRGKSPPEHRWVRKRCAPVRNSLDILNRLHRAEGIGSLRSSGIFVVEAGNTPIS